MDLDGFKERRGQCLIFETKAPGVEIPLGQMIGLKALHSKEGIAIMLIWGKGSPEYGEFWCPNSAKKVAWRGADQAISLVRAWYNWADRQRR